MKLADLPPDFGFRVIVPLWLRLPGMTFRIGRPGPGMPFAMLDPRSFGQKDLAA